MGGRLLVMVAGPYRSGAATDEARRANLAALNRVAHEVHLRGHVPVVGVNLVLPILEATGARFEDVMTPICARLAARCDAVIRVEGASAGADAEVKVVLDRGGRRYRRAADLPPVD